MSVAYNVFSDPELFAVGFDDQVYGQHFNASGSSISGYFLAQPGKVKVLRTTA